MIKSIKIPVFISLFALMAAGCVKAIHEFPVGHGATEVHLVRFDIDPAWQQYPSRSHSRTGYGNFDLRCVVEVYAAGSSRRIARQVVAFDAPGEPYYNTDIVFAGLDRAVYDFVVWADYVPDGTLADYYYATDPATLIVPVGNYRGNDDMRDAFTVTQRVDLSRAGDRYDLELPLSRPFAKYEIIATDLEQYAESGATLDRIDAMKVKIACQGYFPFGYNALSGQPNDAAAGITFTGSVKQSADPSGLLLAYDYIWANDNGSSVRLSMQIDDADGNMVNTATVYIPYRRGCLTTIKDRYLTGRFNPGISIDTGWDDDDINWVMSD